MDKKPVPERHFILYAKRFYHVSQDVPTDIRHLVANYTGRRFHDVTEKDAFRVICEVAIPLILKSENAEYQIKKLLFDLFEIRQSGYFLTMSDFISGLLTPLAKMKVKDGDTILINLGDPDFSILPKAD